MSTTAYDPRGSTDTLIGRAPFVKGSQSGHAPAVKIEPLRYRDVSKTVRTMAASIADDPVEHYFYDTPDADQSRLHKWRRNLVWGIELLDAIRRHQAFTVGGGDALLIMSPPPKDHPESRLDRIISNVKVRAIKSIRSFNAPEQKKRMAEFGNKWREIVQDTIADKVPELFSVDVLATAPAKQGHGYGTALVRHVTAQADAAGRGTWLGSSNVDNTGFYEFAGFSTVAEFKVGDGNPSWEKPLVIVREMVREFERGKN